MKTNFKVYNLIPVVGLGEESGDFATVKEPINVYFIGVGNGFNIYVETSSNDLKYVSGLSKKDGGKTPEEICKEFADAAALDELVRRVKSEDKSVICVETI